MKCLKGGQREGQEKEGEEEKRDSDKLMGKGDGKEKGWETEDE